MSTTTPLMRQYFTIKQSYPDVLLLFQVGDFYELFFEDAKQAAAFLGIALTKRGTHQGEPVPLCGVPVHALDHYLVKLVRGGFRVAICDQLTEARPGKIVERGITQVLTPGTLTDAKLLDDKSASYCAAVVATRDSYGLVFTELLTGHVFVTTVPHDDTALFEGELRRFAPDEVIVPDTKEGERVGLLMRGWGYVTTAITYGASSDEHAFIGWFGEQVCVSHDLIKRCDASFSALALLYGFLKRNNEEALEQDIQLFFYVADDFLVLDAATQRNLELVKNVQDGSTANTLFSIVDGAYTSMGSRMIRKWITRPLVHRQRIEQRLVCVDFLVHNSLLRSSLKEMFKSIGDVERVVGRIALKRAQVHDYQALHRTVAILPDICGVLQSGAEHALFARIIADCSDFSELKTLFDHALHDDMSSEWKIKPGYNQELDRLRSLTETAAQALCALERREQERTGIQSLKIKYNKVHGYSFEVTKANLAAVPEDFQRLQTLVNRERFTTTELKELEYDIARAQRDSLELEGQLYAALCERVALYGARLKKMSQALARCDALVGFARSAYDNNFVCPSFTDSRDIHIVGGRHPVVAKKRGHDFIPNDACLDNTQSMWIITGPNMGGKSTFLRQVALISIMAQAGSFVPAESASLPLVDRVFTRIGAADNVAEGKSTFLVEMEETALICNRATERSLVILDEIGRGTSTYDGLAIAQAVVEYVYHTIKARALFATHYHELTALAENCPTIAVYHAASKQTSSGIILLHKIVQGVADGSFGIEVAKDAQLPDRVIERAKDILRELKQAAHTHEVAQADPTRSEKLAFYAARVAQLEREVAESNRLAQKISAIDYDTLSPKQALDFLWDLKQ